MVKVEISAYSRYPVDRPRLRRLVAGVLARNQVQSRLLVSIKVVGKRLMKRINRDFHGEDRVTDVLSFPYLDPQSSRDQGKFVENTGDDYQVLGDILICYPVAVDEAREKERLVDEVMDFLVEHGLEHLLGHHHE